MDLGVVSTQELRRELFEREVYFTSQDYADALDDALDAMEMTRSPETINTITLQGSVFGTLCELAADTAEEAPPHVRYGAWGFIAFDALTAMCIYRRRCHGNAPQAGSQP